MPHTTCWTLIEDAAGGDGEARAEFAARYLDVVRAYLHARWRARRTGQRAGEVEDAVQEVFVECLREGGVLERARRDGGAGFRAFLLGAARNVARRFEERRAVRRDAPGSAAFDADAVPDEASLTRVFDRAWARAVLKEAVRRMEAGAAGDEERRRVELLQLRFRDGRALADIARDWGEEPALVYRAHERALADFERSLRETVAFHHPSTPERVAHECRELLALIR